MSIVNKTYNLRKLFYFMHRKRRLRFNLTTLPHFPEANCLVTTLNNHITLISIYRSPSNRDTSIFILSLTSLLNSIKTKHIFIVGDINIDIKTNNSDSRASTYLDLMSSFGQLPVHTLATRLDNCLDHVFARTNYTSTALIENSLTDHDTVLLSLEVKKAPSLAGPTYITKYNFINIQNEIKDHDFRSIINSKNTDEAVERFVNELKTIINTN